MFVRSVIIHNQMKIQFGWELAIQSAQELEKLLMAVARHALPDYGSLQDVQRGEQRSCPVAFVIMSHGPASDAFFHLQARLGTIQCLNLTLLIDANHQGLIRRIEIQADYVRQLLYKPLVPR